MVTLKDPSLVALLGILRDGEKVVSMDSNWAVETVDKTDTE